MIEDRNADSDEEEREVQDEELNRSDSEGEPEIEMNWNIMQFLPTAGACQTNFNVSGRGLSDKL
ncbi:hypothetical protein DPMN_079649 [Dreissena polymorpha]|uniref:Uncharacterized protein n=1 Tax=Dreissena polymorpha TaxID=45954 RepID=A0A9D3YU54_DREPO|nr:hypothetical protein DPMN_079649 [Dreissena polymorpha]